MRTVKISLLISFAIATMAHAKVDLVTLPTRDTVQLTIYNSADLTLVRDSGGDYVPDQRPVLAGLLYGHTHQR